MRQFAYALMIFQLFACENKQENSTASTLNGQQAKLRLLEDSGFVVKKDGLPFLLEHALTDTANSLWNEAAESDTVGKYYRAKKGGNYFYCSIDLSDGLSTLLIEMSPSGEMVKSERFFHSFHCCLDNYYDGFHKFGDFFGLKTCATGSGYCASYLYLFTEILPQEKQNSIPQSYWYSAELSQSFSSEIEFQKDALILHGKLEKGKVDGDDFKIKEIQTFKLKYIFENHKWSIGDSSQLDELKFYL